jgi:hypothetical protein
VSISIFIQPMGLRPLSGGYMIAIDWFRNQGWLEMDEGIDQVLERKMY